MEAFGDAKEPPARRSGENNVPSNQHDILVLQHEYLMLLQGRQPFPPRPFHLVLSSGRRYEGLRGLAALLLRELHRYRGRRSQASTPE